MTGLAAFRLPVPHIGAAAAAVSVAAPLPALAYHDLAPGAKYGDVAMSGDGMLSAGLGLALTAGESRCPSSQLLCGLFFPITAQTSISIAMMTCFAHLAVRSALPSTVVFGVAFDYALKFGADDGCIVSGATGEEVCGKIIDRGDQGCVLSDSEGWVCA